MNKQYFVYILTNYTNSVFYTGITNNLQRRILEHRMHVNPNSFTARYRMYKLIWYEEFSDPTTAIENEKRVKDYRRAKKLALIKNMNPMMEDLYAH